MPHIPTPYKAVPSDIDDTVFIMSDALKDAPSTVAVVTGSNAKETAEFIVAACNYMGNKVDLGVLPGQ